MSQLFKIFADCHHGHVNKALHVFGLGLIILGIFQLNFWFVLLGAMLQESGHFYQYYRYRKPQDHPFHCFKPQLVFAYPIVILVLVYIWMSA